MHKTIAILTLVWACASEPPPILGALPHFTLTDHNGRPFGSEQLHGKVWVANFIFTRCPTICPAFTAKMVQVQKKSGSFGPNWHLVSFSVDPDYDNPARLRAFAQRHRANLDNWSFLTGELETIRTVVVDNFKIAMGRDPNIEDQVAALFTWHPLCSRR
jgi:protein SCO1/2